MTTLAQTSRPCGTTDTMPTAQRLTIIVNDEPRSIDGRAMLAAVVTDLGLADRKGVAVAVNGNVIPRGMWPTHVLADGDRVLVIRATQGG